MRSILIENARGSPPTKKGPQYKKVMCKRKVTSLSCPILKVDARTQRMIHDCLFGQKIYFLVGSTIYMDEVT